MSVKVMGWVWDQAEIPPLQKFTLLALADHADDKGDCWPGVSGLVEKTGLSERTIHYHLKTLEENGVLQRVPRQRDDGSIASNLYHIILPWVQQVPILHPTVQQMHPTVQQMQGDGAPHAPHEPSLEPSLLELPNGSSYEKEKGRVQSKKVVQPDHDDIHAAFDPLLGAELVSEQIVLALAHQAAKKTTNLHLYVRNWLRREADRSPFKGGGNHQSKLPPVDFDPVNGWSNIRKVEEEP